jgi:hypothetical protein
MSYLTQADSDHPLTRLQAAACTYRIALGPHAGQKLLSLQSVPGRAADSAQPGCLSAHGFSLHAASRVVGVSDGRLPQARCKSAPLLIDRLLT